jgi:hypothetical protein
MAQAWGQGQHAGAALPVPWAQMALGLPLVAHQAPVGPGGQPPQPPLAPQGGHAQLAPPPVLQAAPAPPPEPPPGAVAEGIELAEDVDSDGE